MIISKKMSAAPYPEPVVVAFPSILTHTKEPHLRSSNLNFFRPTIGVRFKVLDLPLFCFHHSFS